MNQTHMRPPVIPEWYYAAVSAGTPFGHMSLASVAAGKGHTSEARKLIYSNRPG